MSGQDFRFRLTNSRKSSLTVHLEPWGEVYVVKPGMQLQVQARGPIGDVLSDTLEIQSAEDGIMVWGWAGSGVTVSPL